MDVSYSSVKDTTAPFSAPPRERGRGTLRSLAPLLAANALFACGLFVHAFLFNFYLKALGATTTVMGHQAAALTVGGMIALLPTGAVVDRAGARLALTFAAIFTAVALAAGAVVTSTPLIYAAAIGAGAGTSCWRVATAPLLIRATSPHLRARALSWNVALLVATGGIWTAAAGALPAWLERGYGVAPIESIRISLLLGAAVTLASGFLFWRVTGGFTSVPAVDSSDPTRTTSGFSLRGIPVWVLVIIPLVALWMTGYGMVLPFVNIFFTDVWKLPVERVGVIMASGQWVAALGVAVSGEIAHRIGPARMLAAWLLIPAPLLWLLAGSQSLGLSVPLYLVLTIVAPAVFPLVDQVVLERVSESRHGVVSGFRNLATEASGAAGASVGGGVLRLGSFSLLLTVAGGLSMAAAIGLLASLFRGRSRAHSLA